MKLMSHNTMTYRKPKQWYLRPFAFFARCQNKDYKEQYNLGVRGFDLRLFFLPDGQLEFRHGIFRYNGNDFWDIIKFCDDNNIYCRILLEERSYTHKHNDIEILRDRFIDLCEVIEKRYPNLKCFGGSNLNDDDYQILYKFKSFEKIDITELYASVTSLFKSSNKFLAKLDDWCPWYYAKTMNKENLTIFDDKDPNSNFYMMIDFVNIK